MCTFIATADGNVAGCIPRPLKQSPSLRIEEVSAAAHRGRVDALLASHWDEVAKNKRLMVLAPDWDRYDMLEAAGFLFTLAAYAGDELVGYSCNLIDTHLHYSGLKYAQNDVLFVHRDHRASPLGLRLIRRTEQMARERGAKLMMWHAKEDSELAKIMKAKRRPVQDIIFSHEL